MMTERRLTRRGERRHTVRTVLALTVAALGALTVHARPIHAAPLRSVPVNCTGYVAGMQVLAGDVQSFTARAPGLLLPDAVAQERGVARELQTVLHANGKPVDNYKVVARMSDAMDAALSSVQVRVAHRDFTRAGALLTESRGDLADVQLLLREICLPSKVRALPCSGSCVISLVGSGRMIARERPRISFVVPPDYTVHYAWNCANASAEGKQFQLFFEGYSDAQRLTTEAGIALGRYIVHQTGEEHTGTVVRDPGIPRRVLLLVGAEQACQWQMTVARG